MGCVFRGENGRSLVLGGWILVIKGMRKIVYDKESGLILQNIPDGQPQSFEGDFFSLESEKVPKNLFSMKYVDGKFVRLSKTESTELFNYGRILSEEDRTLEGLKPSSEEMYRAERDLEMIEFMEELGL